MLTVLHGEKRQSPERHTGLSCSSRKYLFSPTYLPFCNNSKPSTDAGSMQDWAVVLCHRAFEHLLLRTVEQEHRQIRGAAHGTCRHSRSVRAKSLFQLRAGWEPMALRV